MNSKICRGIITVLLIVGILLSIGINSVAAVVDNKDVTAGERVIINVSKFANPGADGPESKAASPGYRHLYSDGKYVNIHMDFITSDSYYLGSQRHGSDGKVIWAYCIEYNRDANPGLSRYGEISEKTADKIWTKLSADRRRGIMLATLYGYPVSKLGVNAADAYAATQMIIWEFQTGIRTSTTNNTRKAVDYTYEIVGGTKTEHLSADFFYKIISVHPNGIAAYNALVEKIYKHNKAPSFANSTIELKYDTSSGKYTAILKDTNKVLSSYNVTATNGVEVTVSGNTVKLTSSKYVSSAKVNLEKKAQKTTSQGQLVITPNAAGQSLIIGQRQVDVAYTYNVTSLVGNIKIKKTSSDGNISGIKFKVVGPGVNKTYSTDANGTITIKNIPVGEYTITEQTPAKYVAQASKKIKVEKGKTTSVAFENKVISGSLIVTKVDNGTEKPLPGAQFKVYNSKDKVVATGTTNAKGKVTFKNLKYGSYYVVETIAPEGYKLSDKKYEFKIDKEGKEVKTTFSDKNVMYKIGVYKKGNVKTGYTQKKVNGVTVNVPVYEEQYLSGCTVEVYAAENITTADGTVRYKKGKLVDTVVTKKSGAVYTKNLYKGKYTFKETSAPTGYVVSTDSKTVSLTKDKQTVTFKNKIIKGNVTVMKVDAGTERPLSGTKFKLYDSGKKLVGYGTTDSSGKLTFSDLPYGSYYFVESTAPSGYVLSEKKYEFKITKNNQAVKVTVKDTAKMHKIGVYKKGDVITGYTEKEVDGVLTYVPVYEEQYLSGCTVEVYAAEDIVTKDGTVRYKKGKLVDTVVTKDTGVVYTKKLYEGKYTLKEKTAPTGYLLSTKSKAVSLTNDKKTATFSNEMIKGSLVVLKVDKGTTKPIEDAQFIVYDSSDKAVAVGTTNSKGKVTFSDLPYGSYYVVESSAPSGYQLSNERYEFKIDQAVEDLNITCEDENIMHKIGVYKRGEVFKGFDEKKVPIYEEEYLSDCIVEVYASKDIVTGDGTVRFEKGDLVDTVTTNASGPVYTKKLYEGEYFVKEKNAPEGFVLDTSSYEINLFDDEQSVVLNDVRQKCSLSFDKVMKPESYDSVAFGIYTGEEIAGLEAGTLLETIKPDESGKCTMTVDLPCGYEYYLKEIKTADGFIRDKHKYTFTFEPMEQTEQVFVVSINDKNEIVNEHEPEETDETTTKPSKKKTTTTTTKKTETTTKKEKGGTPKSVTRETTTTPSDGGTPLDITRVTEPVPDYPDTLDVSSAEARLFIILAVVSLILIIIIIIRKKKLTLYN